jgi:hypothetical protein
VNQGHILVKVQEKRTPIHGQFVGYRILLAVPNMAGWSLLRRRASPAFRKPYLIEESSDYDAGELLAKMRAKLTELRERGFTQIEEASAYEERMSSCYASLEWCRGRGRTMEEEKKLEAE